MFSSWSWTWEVSIRNLMSGYVFLVDHLVLYIEIFFDSILIIYYITGFISQGNEFSYYMMICSSFILNQ